MREVILSGDNGLIAFMILMFFVLLVAVSENRKVFFQRMKKLWRKLEKKRKYRRYCIVHCREITSMMERREKLEEENRKKMMQDIKTHS